MSRVRTASPAPFSPKMTLSCDIIARVCTRFVIQPLFGSSQQFCFFYLFYRKRRRLLRLAPKDNILSGEHERSGHYRSNNVHVSPTTVSAYCKNYRHFKTAKLHFPKPQSPKSQFKKFSQREKRQIEKAFKELPDILTKFGKITFHRKTFVAADSITSPSEDFAKNIEYYLFEEKILKKKNPGIYKWVKNLMEDNKK